MAIRFDADADYLIRTTGLPSITAFTIMGWLYLSVDTDDWGWAFKFGRLSGSGHLYLVGTAVDGVTLDTWNGATEVTGSVLSLDTWYHVAMTNSGTTANTFKVYLNGVEDISSAGRSLNLAQEIMIGNQKTDFLEENWNGRIAAVKIFSRVLTAAQIKNESRYYLPYDPRNINAFYPFFVHTDVSDISGNGNNLTINGTLTTENGPPIAWAPRPTYVSAFPEVAAVGPETGSLSLVGAGR